MDDIGWWIFGVVILPIVVTAIMVITWVALCQAAGTADEKTGNGHK